MIYLDKQCRCHVDNGGGQYREWEDSGFFTGKSAAFIEGFRVVPDGETWTREDGVEFIGLMIAPAVNFDILQAAQAAHEETLEMISGVKAVAAEHETALLEIASMVAGGVL